MKTPDLPPGLPPLPPIPEGFDRLETRSSNWTPESNVTYFECYDGTARWFGPYNGKPNLLMSVTYLEAVRDEPARVYGAKGHCAVCSLLRESCRCVEFTPLQPPPVCDGCGLYPPRHLKGCLRDEPAKCGHCGGTTIVDNCAMCGAPQCCHDCCAETTREIVESATLMKPKDTPLHVHIVDGDLVVRIGIVRLDGHDNHPDFPELPITDPMLWAADVAGELMRDRGDGATPICLCIDAAIKAAIENGSVGIDYKRPVRRDIDGEPAKDQPASCGTSDWCESAAWPTGVEARVCEDIAARQRVGIAKYGCTVEQSPDDMLRHAYEEALDLAVYLKAELERRAR